MNGYVQFRTLEGDPIVVNADRVSFVRLFRGGDEASAVTSRKATTSWFAVTLKL
jgi:hypothetical protein